MKLRLKGIPTGPATFGVALTLALAPWFSAAQKTAVSASPPASTDGIYPLSQVHRGLVGTAWTVFSGTRPEAMRVQILGVLRGARGPGQDMILAQLEGAKPEYTGVVAGMSGSPVYIGNKLLGSLSYRIGQFSKDPIAGITPIEQMLEVRDIPLRAAVGKVTPNAAPAARMDAGRMNFQAMETPLVMSGFRPEAIRLWQKQMAGTGLDMVSAGGVGGTSQSGDAVSARAVASMEPGSAVSAQLIRGDVEIAATCTVTYIDPKQLLACGHPLLQAGPVSLPMTATEVVTTLASPLNAFKIVNTGELVGAFTQDRDSGIRGVLGAQAHMIPVHISVHGESGERKVNFEVLDLPSLTPQALMVAVYNTLLQSNDSSAQTTYHVSGKIDLDGKMTAPLDVWAVESEGSPAPLAAALATGRDFNQIYANDSREGEVRSIQLSVNAIPRRMEVSLESARLVTGDIVHAGDTVVVEATLRPWQQAARNVRIPIRLPARLQAGNVRVLVSDGGTLDRVLNQPTLGAPPESLNAVVSRARREHGATKVYVSLLVPETQANLDGHTLSSLPLSVANALEPMRAAHDATLNGESAVVGGEAEAGGVLSGFQVLNLHIDAGGGFR
ncbi:MAG TPA: SpoIVB peptidase S55 [Terracidiphilus sp.]|nr:SpoIVB peptidase S55 [Terracidiphilus sp.]